MENRIYATITPLNLSKTAQEGLSMIRIEESIVATAKKVKNVVTIYGALPLSLETLTRILQVGFMKTPDKIIFK